MYLFTTIDYQSPIPGHDPHPGQALAM